MHPWLFGFIIWLLSPALVIAAWAGAAVIKMLANSLIEFLDRIMTPHPRQSPAKDC
jgi:hypothetical protein